MKLTIVFGIFLISMLIFTLSISTTNAQQNSGIPSWIKNNAGWWADGIIDDGSFVSGIEWLVSNNIIEVPATAVSETAESTIPSWVKNTAGWWADSQISDDDFVNAIQYLIKVGIMTVPQTENVLANTSTTESPDTSILDTTSYFEVEVDYIPRPEIAPQFYGMNSEGFRGPEFIKDKPNDIYRIIAIGGSTTFGAGVADENTWPSILEKKLQNISGDKDIEVINAGTPGLNSFSENILVKERLVHYKPDLIIVYDGNNDSACPMHELINKNTIETKEKKIEFCGVYAQDGYYKIFAERWSELCVVGEKNGFETVIIIQPIVSFDKILTDYELDYYFDRKEHAFYLNSLELFAQQVNNIEKHCAVAADFREIFDDYFEPIYWDYVHAGDRGNEIVAGKVLELISPILHEKGITKQILVQPNVIKPSQDPEVILQLYEANWGKLLPNQKIFVGQNLSGNDFSNSNLENEIFFGSDLTNANFENSVLSGSDFSLANLKNANFKNAVVDGIKLRQTILDQTDFTNVDLRQVNLTNVDLTNTILKNSNLSNKDLTKTFLYKSDLSGADLTYSNLSTVYLGDTILKDANLTKALLYEADLSLALDKDLSGTVLTGTDITWSNLIGVDFSGKDLSQTNFHRSDLTGQDFTNNVYFLGNDFVGTNLSNADFEEVNLSPKEQQYTVFKNKAYLMRGVIQSSEAELVIKKELFGNSHVRIFSAEISGNDLAVNYVFFNNFANANLENANFKNADLGYADFYAANLTNADISGADLTNTNLFGADLTDAIIDTNTILKCKNHPICLG